MYVAWARKYMYVEKLKKHIKVDIFGKCGEACEPYKVSWKRLLS